MLLLDDAGLEHYLDTAVAWCEQEGVSFIYDISDDFDSFAEALALKRAEKLRLAEAFRRGAATVGANAPFLAPPVAAHQKEFSPQLTRCHLEHVQVSSYKVSALSQQWRAPSNPSSGGQDLAQHCGILCFGDSLTEGYCIEPEAGSLPLGPITKRVFRPYSDHLERHLAEAGWQPLVVNRGCSGERTESMLLRLPRVLEELAADAIEVTVVLILGGTNDLATSGAAEIFARLAQLHETAWSAGTRTGILTVPELEARRSKTYDQLLAHVQSRRLELNVLLREFAHRNTHRAFFVDVAASFPQDDAHANLWEKDGVHFTAEGYAALGEVIAETMWQGGVAS